MSDPNDLNDLIFYHRREAEECALAQRAIDPSIAGIHRDLAARYAAVIVALEQRIIRPRAMRRSVTAAPLYITRP